MCPLTKTFCFLDDLSNDFSTVVSMVSVKQSPEFVFVLKGDETTPESIPTCTLPRNDIKDYYRFPL